MRLLVESHQMFGTFISRCYASVLTSGLIK